MSANRLDHFSLTPSPQPSQHGYP